MLNQVKTGAAYIRVSTDDQTELSPDAQQRLILDYASKNGISVVEIFIENGISGKKAEKRPEFQRMIALAKNNSHPFDLILVWKFSRFARNQEESIVYKSMLKKDCVEVISVSEPLIEGPFGSLIERIIEWMDEYYSIRLSGEVIRGMTEKALRGGYQSGVPLGYQHNGSGSVPTIIPAEADIVRKIFDLFMTGKDCTAIARQLNQYGYQTKHNNPFERRVVGYILNNPFYIGKVRWNHNCRQVFDDPDKNQPILADGLHQPIIDSAVFEQIQKKLAKTKKTNSSRSVSSCRHWLSGLIKCPVCGSSLSYHKSKYSHFQCWRYSKGYHEGSASLSEKKVILALLESINQIVLTNLLEYSYDHHTTDTSSEYENWQKALKKLKSRETRIALAYEQGIDSLTEYQWKKEKLMSEIQELELAKQQWNNHQNEIFTDQQSLLETHTMIQFLENPAIDYVIKGNALRSILKKITYDRANDIFFFTYYL